MRLVLCVNVGDYKKSATIFCTIKIFFLHERFSNIGIRVGSREGVCTHTHTHAHTYTHTYQKTNEMLLSLEII